MREEVTLEESDLTLKELILKTREWIYYFASEWKVIFLAGVVGAAIGFLISRLEKPVYKAKLNFALEDDKPGGGLGGAMGLASQFGFDLGSGGGGAFSGDNLLELMRSRSIVQKALMTDIDHQGRKVSLAELYLDFTDLRKNWENRPELIRAQFNAASEARGFTRTQDSVLREIHNNIVKNNLIVSKIDKKLSIVSVEFNSKNEIFSKYFTEALVDQVSRFYVDTKTKKSSQNVAILQKQADSVRRQLNGAISGAAASVDLNPNPNMARQVLLAPSQRRQIDVQANAAILTELVKNLEMSKIALRRETPLIQVIDYPILPLEVDQPNLFKSSLIGMFIGTIITIASLFIKKLFVEVMK